MNSSQRLQRLELVLLIVQERIPEIDPRLITIVLQGSKPDASEAHSKPFTLVIREAAPPTLPHDSLLFQDVKDEMQHENFHSGRRGKPSSPSLLNAPLLKTIPLPLIDD